MTETAESRDVQRVKSGRDWYGYLTLENFDAIAERVRSMLEGRRFTWVACNEGLRNYFPEVRTGQQMEKLTVHDRRTYEDGSTHAHFSVCDTYGVWGLSTSVPDQKAAYERDRDDKSLTYLHISHGRYDGGKIEITHHAPVGAELYWVVTVEPEHDERMH